MKLPNGKRVSAQELFKSGYLGVKWLGKDTVVTIANIEGKDFNPEPEGEIRRTVEGPHLKHRIGDDGGECWNRAEAVDEILAKLRRQREHREQHEQCAVMPATEAVG